MSDSSPQTRSYAPAALLPGLTSPPPAAKLPEPPLLAHGVGWFMSFAFGFGTFAGAKDRASSLHDDLLKESQTLMLCMTFQ